MKIVQPWAWLRKLSLTLSLRTVSFEIKRDMPCDETCDSWLAQHRHSTQRPGSANSQSTPVSDTSMEMHSICEHNFGNMFQNACGCASCQSFTTTRAAILVTSYRVSSRRKTRLPFGEVR